MGRAVERPVALQRRTVHAAAVIVLVEGQDAVHRAPVVPKQDVSVAPVMGVGEPVACREADDLLDDRLALVVGQALEMRDDVLAEIEGVAAATTRRYRAGRGPKASRLPPSPPSTTAGRNGYVTGSRPAAPTVACRVCVVFGRDAGCPPQTAFIYV